MRRPAAPADLETRLRRLGLRDVDRVVTHANRTVVLSLARRVLRIHGGYAHAPDPVLAAIVRFLGRGTRRHARRTAERTFLAFPVHVHLPPAPRRERREAPRPGDEAALARLHAAHAALNARHFAGTLRALPILLSGRMRRRLGEVTLCLESGGVLNITISRRHLRADGWAEVEHTLLHEMVHQWQAETGRLVDHGADFRRQAKAVGIAPRAVRALGQRRGGEPPTERYDDL